MNKFFKNNLANILTCCNLLCGCIAINYAFIGLFSQTFYFVILAGAFDFLDGFVARALKSESKIGKELDSLADMVTFGVVPGVILFSFLQVPVLGSLATENPIPEFFKYTGFLVTAFSAIRLANFNVDTRQSNGFIGVPTPANAIFIASLGFIYSNPGLIEYRYLLENIYVLMTLCFVCSLWLVMQVPMIALKFKNFTFKDNSFKYILIVSALLLIMLFKIIAIPLIMILYIILSVTESKLFKKI